MASKGSTTDFDATVAVFEPSVLADADGMQRATDLLTALLESRTKRPLDPRWAPRCVAVLRTPFPRDHRHESARAALLRTAGSVLVLRLGALRQASTAQLLELLRLGGDARDGGDVRYRYILELVGKLGTPADVPALCAWFEARPGRELGSGMTSVHAVMVNALMRLANAETLALLSHALEQDSAGKAPLGKHQRWAYERTVEGLMAGERPAVGTNFLPEPRGVG
ncbi:MAG: hypothetical protein HS104_10725 [Polyangiaceae bacterium]|nr:hypothetical protein [Polyangiaceae bacterium]MCE7889278.1 hypothetical protein [Sorangiineae bacterium PRO1]